FLIQPSGVLPPVSPIGFGCKDWPFSSSPPANEPKSSPPSFLQSIHCLVVIASAARVIASDRRERGNLGLEIASSQQTAPRNDRLGCSRTGPAGRKRQVTFSVSRCLYRETEPMRKIQRISQITGAERV